MVSVKLTAQGSPKIKKLRIYDEKNKNIFNKIIFFIHIYILVCNGIPQTDFFLYSIDIFTVGSSSFMYSIGLKYNRFHLIVSKSFSKQEGSYCKIFGNGKYTTYIVT